ncbi:SDR family oxidoreductase [Sphingomonas jatrophae]|uniref:NADP-dependent 3-hydroxy acid dehydrogenase YdfG n=1 Tax=Sphingomonas jatrophae TaxID=1166337 RepID=A0A1I6M005_9SPHN|nr:SDR family oxidoreductase [Sphingomonas jatrophae]SFS09049.1 NADP-dependent 3-hydroxy acid dehydrogenase YdfG [Sphingomonas jatrophae]
MLLKDKVVIVVGVGPGMGQAMAIIAAREGAKVALGARNQAYIDGVARQITDAGGEAIALSTDVTKSDQCVALANATAERFGRIDGLVNSAYAPGENGAFEDADVEGWANTIDVACLGSARMAQAVLPHMKANGGGAIVNVATMQAQKHLPGGSLSYAIAKGALVTASRQLAAELGQHNIRVNATRMGWLWGEPVRNALQGIAAANGTSMDELVAGVSAGIALGVIPPEEECAKSVLMFVSDYTKMVSGAVLDVNGGEWMAP